MGHYTTIIAGAGAAGLHCAAFAKEAGSVLVIDHAKKPAEKIRISGGGRCNFTNIHAGPQNFISENPHFAKSALARYTPWDFIDLVSRHGIAFHEKTLGQQFCDKSANDIIRMLLDEMKPAELLLETGIEKITKADAGFTLYLSNRSCVTCDNLVIATGGKSIPKMGATGFGYQVAAQFGLPVTETRAGLVPLTFGGSDLEFMKSLAGVALPVRISCNGTSFDEAMLFTHRGLSGPAILQISSYWRERDAITIDLLPGIAVAEHIRSVKAKAGKRQIETVLAELMPQRLAQALCNLWSHGGNVADMPDRTLGALEDRLHGWTILPIGTEGYRTAEVTLGGVSTDALDARTMEAKSVPGLYFIGEVVDVTGWLGGFNFQWAWASAHAAGTAIAGKAGR